MKLRSSKHTPRTEPGASADDDHEMIFESAARKAVAKSVESAVFDQERRIISLIIGVDHKANPRRVEFESWEDLDTALTELATTEWINYVPYDDGPVFEPNVDGYVQDALERLGAEDFFDGVSRPRKGDALFDSEELLTPEGAKSLRVTLASINEELIRHLAKHPEKMHDLHPRRFEELVAELFRDQGYDVELTRYSKDGGFDIRAVRRTDVGLGLTLIECKHYSDGHRVGVEFVRSLHGVVEAEGATNGLLVTTSYFTSGAKAFRDRRKYRLELADYDRFCEMLAGYKRTEARPG